MGGLLSPFLLFDPAPPNLFSSLRPLDVFSGEIRASPTQRKTPFPPLKKKKKRAGYQDFWPAVKCVYVDVERVEKKIECPTSCAQEARAAGYSFI